MKMCKIFLIVCFTISSLFLRISQSRGINDVEQLELAPKIGSHKCVCFPENDSGVRASDYISPDYNEQERLVVYFYKDVNSDKFTVYVPNAEKQGIFPDLLVEEDDIVEKKISDTYFDLFKIDKKYFQTALEQKSIQIPKYSDKNLVHPLNVTYFSIQDLPYNNQLNGDGFDLAEDTNQFSFSNINSTGQSTLQITQSNQKVNSPLEHIHRPVNEITPEKITNSADAGRPNRDDSGNLLTPFKYSDQIIKFNDKLNTLVTPNLEHENLSTTTNEKELGEKYYIKQIVPENIDVPTPDLMNFVNPSWIDITLPSNTYQDTSFEKWFIHQIQNVRSKRPSMSNLIDFHTLKFLLKKALYDNGIRLANNDQLYDSNGNIIDMTKLKLRPILLGNPLDYEKLIASRKCVIPYDIPYLEALLVTLVYPPKILAIIPLRKILISKESKNIILPDPGKIIYDRPECDTKKCLHQKTNDIDSDKMTENEILPKYYNFEWSSKTDEENKQVLSKTSNGKTNDISKSGVKNSNNELENEYSSALSRTLSPQEHYSKYNTYMNEENDLKLPLEQNPTQDIDVAEEVANKPKDEDYDMIGYRIVGGNPATSSGTPVSNRGRSGDGKVIHKWIRIGR